MLHAYEIRPRKDHRGVDLISDALPFGRLWYVEASDAIDYAKHRRRSHDAVIRVYDAAGHVIGTQEHTGDRRARERHVDRAGRSRAWRLPTGSRVFRASSGARTRHGRHREVLDSRGQTSLCRLVYLIHPILEPRCHDYRQRPLYHLSGTPHLRPDSSHSGTNHRQVSKASAPTKSGGKGMSWIAH